MPDLSRWRPAVRRALLAMAVLVAGPAVAVELVLESWRTDDTRAWQDNIIPAFEAAHPGISIRFAPSAEYRTALGTRLAAGTAGDLVTCEPFDSSLALYQAGHLADLDGLPGLAAFPAASRAAWQTDAGDATYCVPVAAVIHGFIYNRAVFDTLGLAVPRTETDFFAALDRILAAGTHVPLAMGTLEQWEAGIMGYGNIGPTYWGGEAGRTALVAGTAKLTDPAWTAPFAVLARWRPYLGDGFEAQSYADSQNLFTLGRAAVYPAGSWEIAGFRARAAFPLGAFPPPVQAEGDTCQVTDHADLAIGLNTASTNQDAARQFLAWLTTADFATLYANTLPGYFTLSPHAVELDDPLAREFASWRQRCHGTIRVATRHLSRGTPNLEYGMIGAAVAALKGKATPAELGAGLQRDLDSWYVPPSQP